MIDGRPVLFDALEFDAAMATGDVLYDLAFAIMDLDARDIRWAANLLLNRYLWTMDDEATYGALALLPLFLSLRAAIRANVVLAGSFRQMNESGPDMRADARSGLRRTATAWVSSGQAS